MITRNLILSMLQLAQLKTLTVCVENIPDYYS